MDTMEENKTEVFITEDHLDVGKASAIVSSPECGAISLFIGTTRDNFGDKKVMSLEYECYKEMAESEIRNICKELREKWPELKHIAVFHRLGQVPVLEASVIIAISSPHREAAIKAVEHGIDTLKQKVPIWKKEKYEDGTNNWKANNECEWK